MKKTYIAPVMEEMLAETEELMETSFGVYEEEVTGADVLSREAGFNLNNIFE